MLGVESRLVSMGMLDDRQKQDRSTDSRTDQLIYGRQLPSFIF